MNDARMIRLVSRALAVYFASCAILDCTYLPQYLHSLIHHMNDDGLRDSAYWRRYYLLETASLTLRTALTALAAILFWNVGPKVKRLFSTAGLVDAESSDGFKSSQP